MQKFPVNQATVAGLVTRAVFNEEANRANVTVAVNDGNSVQYTNVLISGEERFKNFKENFNNALKSLGKKEDGQQMYPLMAIKGEAFFSVNENNGIKNQNYTLIASGSLSDSNSEKFKLTKTALEMTDFREEINQTSSANNQIKIRGVIASEHKMIETAKGSIVKLSIAHNYMKNDQQKAMFANVILPSKVGKAFMNEHYQKGSKVLLEAKPQSSSYDNKDGIKVYTFNLITSSIKKDINKATTVDKTIESEKVVSKEKTNIKKPSNSRVAQEKGM